MSNNLSWENKKFTLPISFSPPVYLENIIIICFVYFAFWGACIGQIP
jgi:hypothetical protein